MAHHIGQGIFMEPIEHLERAFDLVQKMGQRGDDRLTQLFRKCIVEPQATEGPHARVWRPIEGDEPTRFRGYVQRLKPVLDQLLLHETLPENSLADILSLSQDICTSLNKYGQSEPFTEEERGLLNAASEMLVKSKKIQLHQQIAKLKKHYVYIEEPKEPISLDSISEKEVEILAKTHEICTSLQKSEETRALTEEEQLLMSTASQIYLTVKNRRLQQQIAELKEQNIDVEELKEPITFDSCNAKEEEIKTAIIKDEISCSLENLSMESTSLQFIAPWTQSEIASIREWIQSTRSTLESIDLDQGKELIKIMNDFSRKIDDMKKLNLDFQGLEAEIQHLKMLQDTFVERLSEHASERLKTGFESRLEQLYALTQKQCSNRAELEQTVRKYREEVKHLLHDIRREAIECAKNIPASTQKESPLFALLFSTEAEKVQKFIHEHLAEVLAETFATKQIAKASLKEGGKKICVLKAFYHEGEREVYIFVPLGKGEYKSVKLGFSLLASAKPELAVIAFERKGLLPDAMLQEFKAIDQLQETFGDEYPTYVLRMRKAGDVEHLVFGLLEEYCDGGTLEDVIKTTEHPLSAKDLNEALRYSEELAQALEDTHKAKLVHLDLKPANVFFKMVGGKRTVRLGDFGLSLTEGEPRDGIRGSTAYIAPEVLQADGWTAHPSIDMWSFGLNLLETVCGKEANLIKRQMELAVPPFDSLDWRQKTALFESAYQETMKKLDEQPIPEKTKKLIRDLLKMNPEDRPSATEAKERLQEMRRELPTPTD